ncbi:TPA: hypothetical protein ACOG4Y_002772 [Staphylococcus aureus]
MNALYKTTLLTTMAVVTWKVWKIERNTRKPVINRNDFRVPYVLEEGVNVKKSMNNLYKVSLDFFAKSIIADNYEADNPENQQLF